MGGLAVDGRAEFEALLDAGAEAAIAAPKSSAMRGPGLVGLQLAEAPVELVDVVGKGRGGGRCAGDVGYQLANALIFGGGLGSTNPSRVGMARARISPGPHPLPDLLP